MRKFNFVALFVVAVLLVPAFLSAQTLSARFIGRPEVLADNSTVPFADQIPEGALCFKVKMFNVEGTERIGTGWDCLSNIVTDDDFVTLSLTDHTVFKFAGSGIILGVGEVSIMSPFAGTVAAPSTHMTGSSSAVDNILDGSGIFAGATGKMRLSGLVDMSTLLVDGFLGFDCLFVIELN